MNKLAKMILDNERLGNFDRNDRGYDSRDYRDYRDMEQDSRRGRSRDYNYDNAYDRGYQDDYNRRDRNYDDNYDSRDMHGKGLKDFPRADAYEWGQNLENGDGTHGKHFNMEQCEKVAKDCGMDIEQIGPVAFCAAMNMMYSDYCEVAKKYGVNNPSYYADLAKAFLKDSDFNGTGAEKLYLYYKCISCSK